MQDLSERKWVLFAWELKIIFISLALHLALPLVALTTADRFFTPCLPHCYCLMLIKSTFHTVFLVWMINETVYFIRNTLVVGKKVTLLRKSRIKYNWPYLISFPTGNIAWQKAVATGTILYLGHVCHIQILWNLLGKNPFLTWS